MSDVVVLIPVLDRPHRAQPLVDSILRAQVRVETRPLFIVSHGDHAELEAVEATGADYLLAPLPPGPGDYARKINFAMAASGEPWLFTGADDLAFRAGWADRALECGSDRYGVVGTNDLGNATVMRGDHSTHSLIRREYAVHFGTADEPGKIFHEGYDHQYCDTELVATAKARGQFVFCRESLVEHLHPFWGKAERDATYEKGLARGRDDQALFNSRRRLWV